MMNVFAEIKDSVSVAEVFVLYGVHINNGGFARCPFHNEKTPSLKIYRDAGTFHCFGCGVGGSVIDFVARLYGLTPIEAAKKLSDDFNLDLFDTKLSPARRQEINNARAEREADNALLKGFEAWRSERLKGLYAEMWRAKDIDRLYDRMLLCFMRDEHAALLHRLPIIEHYIEFYESDDISNLVSTYLHETGGISVNDERRTANRERVKITV